MAQAPHWQYARYNSLQEFQAFMRGEDNTPSYTNLFSLRFASPPIFSRGMGPHQGADLQAETGDLEKLLDFYAASVSLPSKQVTSGQAINVGSPVKYATGSAFSQFQVNFVMPESQLTRLFFERWVSKIANDANQYTEFYNNYVSPHIRIYKYERGGGEKVGAYGVGSGHQDDIDKKFFNDFGRMNKVTAMWELRNCYPYNIGSAQLNNSSSSLMTIGVSFYYERYRFYPEVRFEEPDVRQWVEIPNSSYWDGAGTACINNFIDNYGTVYVGDFFTNSSNMA